MSPSSPQPPSALRDVAAVPHGRTARRLTWPHLPPALRSLVEERLGGRVVAHESQDSGFTPGFASRLTLTDGSRVFLKAASRRAQRPFAESYAAEAAVVRRLPTALPMPRLRWSHEDDSWVTLAFDCVEGRQPQRPWRPRDLAACLDALQQVADQVPVPPDGLALRPLHEDVPDLLTAWEQVRVSDPGLPHLDEAAALARRLPELPGGHRFAHADARDDNFLLTGDGRALLCDWNWPCLAPPWLDAVVLVLSAFGDGHDADAWLARASLTAEVPAEEVDVWLAALTGFMRQASAKPAPAASPFLSVHSRWYAAAGMDWLSRRRGWA